MTAAIEALVWTIEEAAFRLKISVRKLRDLTNSGAVPVVAIGSRRLYRETDLRAYIESLAAAPTSPGVPPRSPTAKPA